MLPCLLPRWWTWHKSSRCMRRVWRGERRIARRPPWAPRRIVCVSCAARWCSRICGERSSRWTTTTRAEPFVRPFFVSLCVCYLSSNLIYTLDFASSPQPSPNSISFLSFSFDVSSSFYIKQQFDNCDRRWTLVLVGVASIRHSIKRPCSIRLRRALLDCKWASVSESLGKLHKYKTYKQQMQNEAYKSQMKMTNEQQQNN